MTQRVEFHDEPEDLELEQALRAIQHAIMTHPIAAQAIFYALVREGRAYAETDEGAAWRDRLAGSELVVRARVLWDALTVRALEDDEQTVLPTAILEAMVKAASSPNMEAVLEDLFIDGMLGGQ